MCDPVINYETTRKKYEKENSVNQILDFLKYQEKYISCRKKEEDLLIFSTNPESRQYQDLTDILIETIVSSNLKFKNKVVFSKLIKTDYQKSKFCKLLEKVEALNEF